MITKRDFIVHDDEKISKNNQTYELSNFDSVQKLSNGSAKKTTTFYYWVNLLEAGAGGGDNDEPFVEWDFGRIALGYKIPLLFGLTCIRVDYLLPSLGLSNIVSDPIWGVYYPIFNRDLTSSKTKILLYVEGSSRGNYRYQTDSEEEAQDYKHKHLDLGVSLSFPERWSILGISTNTVDVSVVGRFVRTEPKTDVPITGMYASLKFNLGWMGKISLK